MSSKEIKQIFRLPVRFRRLESLYIVGVFYYCTATQSEILKIERLEMSQPLLEQQAGSGEKTVSRRRKLRVGAMVVILMAELILFLWFLHRDPLTAYQLGLIHQQAAPSPPAINYSAVLKHDPPLGMIMPDSGIGKVVRETAPPSKIGYLVGYVGACAGCLHVDLKAWQREAKQHHVSMILFTTADHATAQNFRKSMGLKVPIISDLHSKLTKQLNAVWPGRSYLFSPNWHLLWLDKSPVPMDDPFNHKLLHRLVSYEGRTAGR